jgi:hypothetical protein
MEKHTMLPDEDENEVLAEIGEPENAELYIAERREDAKPADPDSDPEIEQLKDAVREKAGLEDTRKTSRHERRKLARERLQAENESLRSQLPQEPSASGDDWKPSPTAQDVGALETSLEFAGKTHGPERLAEAVAAFHGYVSQTRDQAAYQAVMGADDIGEALIKWHAANADQLVEMAAERGRYDQEVNSRVEAQRERIEVAANARARVEQFRMIQPDYDQVVSQIEGISIPDPLLGMIAKSDIGPHIAYALAKDAYEGNGIIFQLESLEGNPQAQAYYFGMIENSLRTGINRGINSPTPRVTKAPPPIKPLAGGSSGHTDISTLSPGEDASDYIRARRG